MLILSPAVPELDSIVTPFHDDLRFFDDTVASVFGQTYPEWEWLLVDDGYHARLRREGEDVRCLSSRTRQVSPSA